jgi:hypothetical protein
MSLGRVPVRRSQRVRTDPIPLTRRGHNKVITTSGRSVGNVRKLGVEIR